MYRKKNLRKGYQDANAEKEGNEYGLGLFNWIRMMIYVIFLYALFKIKRIFLKYLIFDTLRSITFLRVNVSEWNFQGALNTL